MAGDTGGASERADDRCRAESPGQKRVSGGAAMKKAGMGSTPAGFMQRVALDQNLTLYARPSNCMWVFQVPRVVSPLPVQVVASGLQLLL